MRKLKAGDLRPLVYLGGAVVLWGTSFAVTKSAYAALPPMYVVWLRMVMALVAFLPLLPLVKRPDYRRGDWKLLAMATLFIPCLYFALEGSAIQYTTSSQAGVVAAVMPLIVAVSAWVVLRERPARATVVAVLVSMAGVAALSLGGSSQASAPNPALGNLLELGAMVAAAGATLTIKRLSERYDPLLITGLQMAVGSVFFAPLALASGPVDLAAVPLPAWAAVAYLGVGCGLAAFALYNSGLRLVPATRAALTINAVPAVAMLTGWLALGETMAPLQVAACGLIVGSVVYAELGGRNRARPEARPETPELLPDPR
ncbi:MAG: EamA family transporter [Propionicimonas sp.]|nr:EamA family transporter [Propionicimonas sp.]